MRGYVDLSQGHVQHQLRTLPSIIKDHGVDCRDVEIFLESARSYNRGVGSQVSTAFDANH